MIRLTMANKYPQLFQQGLRAMLSKIHNMVSRLINMHSRREVEPSKTFLEFVKIREECHLVDVTNMSDEEFMKLFS